MINSVTYSILEIPLNQSTGEKISIGLVLFYNNEGIYFKYSKKKLKILKILLPINAYRLLSVYTKAINKNFDGKNYYSPGSNNLIRFTKPSVIQIECTENNFKKLYKKLIKNER